MKRLFGIFLCMLSFSVVAFATEGSSGNFVYISTEGEIIHNGKSLGYGANLIVDRKDFAYEKIVEGKIHVVLNGKDVGEGYRPQITEGKLLYEVEKNFKNTIVFDGKNYGEGYDPLVKDGHFVYFKKIQGDHLRNTDQGLIQAYYDGKYYCDAKDEKIKENISFSGEKVICEQTITSQGVSKTFIIYQGKVIDEGFKPHVSKTHYQYSKTVQYGDKKLDVIIFDGKAIGEGYDFEFSEESYFYIRKDVYAKEEIVFNGTPLGAFKSLDTIYFKDGHIAFLREKKIKERDEKGQMNEVTYTYIYHDGVEKGVVDTSSKVFLAKDHIAFERTLKGYDYGVDGKMKPLDVTYAVYDGRERTSIEKGTLQMDDTGVFGFAKKQLEFDSNEPTGEKDEEGNDIKGKYVDKTYVFRGETSGAVKRLTEGEPLTLRVKDGRVAYVKKDTETRNINDNGKTISVAVEVSLIMIDGVKKGVGDITTLVMDQGQYAFAENKKGRLFLTINAKEQVFPGYDVKFLEKESVTAQTASQIMMKYGKLRVQGAVYSLISEEGNLRIVPDEKMKVSLNKYKGKQLYVKIEEKKYKSKNAGTVITAYKLHAFSEKAFPVSQKKSYKGILKSVGGGYKLQVSNKSYPIIVKSPLKSSDLESFVGDTVEFEAILSNGDLEISSLPK